MNGETTLRERNEDLMAEARVWRQNYNAAIALASIFAPPDLLEVLEDKTLREFQEVTR